MRGKSGFRKVRILILATGAVIISSIALAPQILSTSYAKDAFAKILSKKMNCSVQVQSLSLSWFASQHLYGITYNDLAGTLFMSCESIESSSSLWAILIKSQYGDIHIAAPHIKIKKDLHPPVKATQVSMQKGSMLTIPGWQELIAARFSKVEGTIKISSGCIDLTCPDIDPISIYDMESMIQLPNKQKDCSISLRASTEQNKQKGSVSFDGSVKDILSKDASCDIKGSVISFPIKVIDQISALFISGCKGFMEEMVGETLSMNLSGRLSQNNAFLDITASSSKLKIQLSTLSDGRAITLKNPADIQLSLSPKVLCTFAPMIDKLPIAALDLSARVSNLSIPIEETGIQWRALEVAAGITTAPLQIQGLERADYTIGGIELSISRPAQANDMQVGIYCPIKTKEGLSEINIEGTLPLLPSLSSDGHLLAHFNKIPTPLLNTLLNSSWASVILGEYVSGSAMLTQFASNTPWKLQLSTKTPTLAIEEAHILLGEKIELQTPCFIEANPSIELIKKLTTGLNVSLALPIKIEVNKMILPPSEPLQNLQLQATIKASEIQVQQLSHNSPYIFNAIESTISIDSLNQIDIGLKSNLINLNVSGLYDQNRMECGIRKGSSIKWQLTDQQLQHLMPAADRPYLTSPSNLVIDIEQATIPLEKGDLSNLKINANLFCQELLFENKDSSYQSSLQNTKLGIDMQADGANIKVIGSTTVIDKEQNKGMLSTEISTTISEPHTWAVRLQIKDIPTKALQMLSGKTSRLEHIIGNKINLRGDIQKDAAYQQMALELSTDNIQLQGNLSVANGVVSISGNPIKGSIKITPSSYLEIDRIITHQEPSTTYQLIKDSTFAFEVSQLQIPLGNKDSPAFDSLLSMMIKAGSMKGKISNDSLRLTTPSNKQAIHLKNMMMAIEKKSPDSPLELLLSTEAISANSKGSEQSGLLNAKGSITDLTEKDGRLDLSKISSSIDVQIHRMPSAVFDFFARSLGDCSSSFNAIFGPVLSVEGRIQLKNASGPISMNINSPGTRASINGSLSNGTLLLTEPIYAQVNMTPELSHFLLAGVNPLSITEIRAQHPITMEVDPKGFSIPLTDFEMSKVNIPNAKIELGQIGCKNEGNLNIALSLLKSVQLSQNNNLSLWFSPIDLHIKEGTVDVERTEILIAETFDIAIWGTIQPVKNKVDMVLGLTADCLSKAFSISNLPQDYVLQIPMTGTLQDVKINTGKATAKVAALLALKQADIAGGVAGGPAGALFGKFINKLGSLPLNDKGTPPAKHPFPWETGKVKKTPPAEPAQPKKRKAHIKQKDKPLKQALKIIR